MAYPYDTDDNTAITWLGDATVDTFTDPDTAYVATFPDALTKVARVANAVSDAAAAAESAASSAASLTGTSTTTFTPAIDGGSHQSITTQAGKSWPAGTELVISSQANPTTNKGYGTVVSYSGTTLVVSFHTIGASPASANDWNIALSGAQGADGVDGTGAGNRYTFSSSTSGDPGSGKFLLNNATLSSATQLNISETDGHSNNLAALWAAIDDSTSTNKAVLIFESSDGTKGIAGFITSTLTDAGSYDTFSWSPVTSWGTPANGDIFFVSISITGNKGDTGSTGSTGATGSAGADGSDGSNGADGANAGNKYTFNSATSGDPGSGKFLVNNATLASATQVNISETDGDSGALAAYLAAIDNGSSSNKALFLFKTATGAKGIVGYITSTLTDAGSYDTFTWSPVTAWGSPANNEVMFLTIVPVGDKGDQGLTGDTGATGSAGADGSDGVDGANGGNKYIFSTSTSGDPGSGKFLLNNATIASTTQLNISETDADSAGIAAYIATFDDSSSSDKAILIFKAADGSKGIIGKITGTLTDAGGYDTFPWEYITDWGSPGNGDTLYLNVRPNGDKGETGASGSGAGNFNGPGSSTTHNLVAFGDTSGQLGEDSGLLTSDVVTKTGTQTLTNKTLTAPTMTTPTLGAATATSVNKVAITAPASSATLTIPDGVTLTGPAASGTAMTLGNAETVTGAKTFNDSTILMKGSSSGTGTLKAPAAASTYAWTLPAATTTLAGLGFAQTWTAAQTFNDSNLLLAGSSSGAGTLKAPAAASTYSWTLPAATATLAGLGFAQTWSAAQTFNDGNLLLAGSSSGAGTLKAPSAASTYVWTLPAATVTLASLTGTETLTNKTLTAPQFADGGYIADANGNEQIVFHQTASAVNQVGVTNSATGNPVAIAAEGGDTNIALKVSGKGNKGVAVDNALLGKSVTLTDGATPALDASLGNFFVLSAAGNRTVAVPSNPQGDGQTITIAHLASGGARTLSLNTGTNGFAFGSDITSLSATASGKWDYITCRWNATAAKWHVLGVIKGF